MATRARADARVSGHDPDEHVLRRALELGAIDEAADDPAGAVGQAQTVFVATPMRALEGAVAEALQAVGSECVVSDVGSTKRALAERGFDGRFIGGHPLAGAETAGIEHARETLFEDATWYLTPGPQTPPNLHERLRNLIAQMGARPVQIEAEDHDRLMARVSHLPHVLANLLVAQAAEALDGRKDSLGPSFRDATRVAGANTTIWPDIYLSNSEALVEAIDEATERLAVIRADLLAGDRAALAAWHERAHAERAKLMHGER
jgi:prephenate dehydrogenase